MNNYSVGNRVLHPNYGEGMVSNINDTTLEILFLNGGKLLFQINDPEISLVAPTENVTATVNQPQLKNSISDNVPVVNRNSEELTVGSRVMHFEYGEGMVTKVTKNEIEVIFLNDSKYNFIKNSGEITPLPSLIPQKNIQSQTNSTKIPPKPSVTTPAINSNNTVFHKTFGEGMISKIFDDKMEVIFLDGSKRIFAKDSLEILPYEANKETFGSKPQILKQELNIDKSVKNNENKLGNQVFHPKYGEGMVSKIHKNEYEVTFVDGSKMILPKNEFTQKKLDLTFDNSPQFETTVKPIQEQAEPEISYNNPLIGKQIFHNRLGEALIIGVGNDFYEVMFLDGKKLVLPKNQFTEVSKQENTPANSEKTSEIPSFIENNDILANSEKKQTKTDKKTTEQNDNAPQIIFSIGTIVLHPKHGEGIISFTDDTEVEVVFKNNKKITYSKNNNELKIKPSEPKVKKADIKTLYKKLFLIEDTLTNNEKIEKEVKEKLLQEIKDVFSILDAKFQNCEENKKK